MKGHVVRVQPAAGTIRFQVTPNPARESIDLAQHLQCCQCAIPDAEEQAVVADLRAIGGMQCVVFAACCRACSYCLLIDVQV